MHSPSLGNDRKEDNSETSAKCETEFFTAVLSPTQREPFIREIFWHATKYLCVMLDCLVKRHRL